MRALLAGAILAAAACGNAFSSSSSPATDGGADVSTADVSGPDGGTADTGVDGSSPQDAATDVPIGPAEAGTDWCATHPATFCEDFDTFANVTAFLSTWSYSTIGGTFTFDQTSVPSPPNALHITTTSTSNVRNLAFHVMPTTGTNVISQRLEFELRINEAKGIDGLSAAAVAAIVFGKDVSSGAVALSFGNGSGVNPATLSAAYLGPSPDGGLPAFGTANAPPPFPTLGEWDGRFAIEIQYGPATDAGPLACAQIYVGTFAQLSPCLALPPSLSRPTLTSIALGVYSGGIGNTGTVDVEFDNVTFASQ